MKRFFFKMGVEKGVVVLDKSTLVFLCVFDIEKNAKICYTIYDKTWNMKFVQKVHIKLHW